MVSSLGHVYLHPACAPKASHNSCAKTWHHGRQVSIDCNQVLQYLGWEMHLHTFISQKSPQFSWIKNVQIYKLLNFSKVSKAATSLLHGMWASLPLIICESATGAVNWIWQKKCWIQGRQGTWECSRSQGTTCCRCYHQALDSMTLQNAEENPEGGQGDVDDHDHDDESWSMIIIFFIIMLCWCCTSQWLPVSTPY